MLRIMLIVTLLSLVLAGLPGSAAAQDDRLTETFMSSDGSLTFNYPAGWQVGERESDRLNFSAYFSLFIADMGNPQLFFGEGYVLNASNIDATPSGGPKLNDSITSVIRYFADQSLAPYGEIQSLVVGEKQAGYATPPPDFLPLTYMVAVALGDGNYFLMELLSVRDQAAFEDIFFAVLATIHFEPPIAAELVFPDPVPGTDPVVWQIGEMRDPCFGVAAGPDDTLYLSCMVYNPSLDSFTGGVVMLDAGGHVLSAFSNPELPPNVSVALGDDGTLWLADPYDRELHHFNPQGDLLGTIILDASGTLLTWVAELDQDGNLVSLNTEYHGEPGQPGLVMVYSPDGEKLREFTVYEAGVFAFGTEWDSPPSLALGLDGRIYVATAYPFTPVTVRVFDAAGNPLDDHFAADLTDESIKSVYVAPDVGVYLLPLSGTALYHYTPDGERLDTVELPEKANSLLAVQPLAMLSDGSLVILGNNSITRLDMN